MPLSFRTFEKMYRNLSTESDRVYAGNGLLYNENPRKFGWLRLRIAHKLYEEMGRATIVIAGKSLQNIEPQIISS
jgi:hypothetical protein